MEVFTIFLVDPSLFSIFQFFATHSPFSLLALWFLILLSRRSLALDLSVVSIVSRMAYSTESLFFFQALARSLAPLGDRILVRRAAKETMTAGGILLPSDNAKSPNEGEVIAVGPGIRDVSGNLHAPTLKSGDSVLLPEYGGSKIKIDGDEMFLYREDDILGKYE